MNSKAMPVLPSGSSRPCRYRVARKPGGKGGPGARNSTGFRVRLAQSRGFGAGQREAGRATARPPGRRLYAKPGSRNCLPKATRSPAGFCGGPAFGLGALGGSVQGRRSRAWAEA